MKKQTYSCYLVKNGVEVPEAVLRDGIEAERIELVSEGFAAVSFIRSKSPYSPPWATLLSQYTDEPLTDLLTASASALVVVPHGERMFAIPYGYGWTMINGEMIEDNFGLRVVLNSVSADSLRALDAKSFDGATITHRRQASRNTTVQGFGLDVEKNLLSAATGTPTDNEFWGSYLDGKDQVRFSTNQNLHELEEKFDRLLELNQDDSYKEQHPWVDLIREERNPGRIAELNETLVQLINDRTLHRSWLTQVETVDRAVLKGFKYRDTKKAKIYEELSWDALFDEFSNRDNFDLDWLKKQYVYAINESNDESLARWQLLKCIYCEIEDGEWAYFLSDGKWYLIRSDYLSQVNDAIADLFVHESYLPKCENKSESKYNEFVHECEDNSLELMDKKLIKLSKQETSMEFCDLMGTGGEMVHVKHYTGSSTLSHLFNQGLNSAVLLKSHPSFREKANEYLPASMKLPDKAGRLIASDYTVAFGIIRPGGVTNLDLPLFSRLTLRHVATQIRGMEFNVEVHMIDGTKPPKKSKKQSVDDSLSEAAD